MATITRTSFSTGDIPTASEWNTQFDTVYNLVNGNLDNDNISSSAAIGGSKLNLEDAVTTPASLDGGIDTGDNIQLKFKTINIGDWDMNATSTISVAHGLTLSTIRGVMITIRDDSDTNYFPVAQFRDAATEANCYVGAINNTNVIINRLTGGVFDSTSYDSTSYNRGWVIIWYTA